MGKTGIFGSWIALRSQETPVGITIPTKARSTALSLSAGLTESFVVTMECPSQDRGEKLEVPSFVIPVSCFTANVAFLSSLTNKHENISPEIIMNSERKLIERMRESI